MLCFSFLPSRLRLSLESLPLHSTRIRTRNSAYVLNYSLLPNKVRDLGHMAFSTVMICYWCSNPAKRVVYRWAKTLLAACELMCVARSIGVCFPPTKRICCSGFLQTGYRFMAELNAAMTPFFTVIFWTATRGRTPVFTVTYITIRCIVADPGELFPSSVSRISL